ncbi:hypothetical protein VNO77_34631 [Canavalia gladiata]|uniref:Uncharacterized protein n=1 Tax=Canavalia gladiata TaxID=3824 RepID=A0AAN9KEK0_CANGL
MVVRIGNLASGLKAKRQCPPWDAPLGPLIPTPRLDSFSPRKFSQAPKKRQVTKEKKQPPGPESPSPFSFFLSC